MYNGRVTCYQNLAGLFCVSVPKRKENKRMSFLKKRIGWEGMVYCCGKIALGLILTVGAVSVMADVKLANVFRNNGVIQCDKPAPLWGLAEPGEKINVTLTGIDGTKLTQKKETIADKHGKWVVTLDPLQAGVQFHINVKGEKSKDASYNMKAGEVWFYAGYYRHRYLRSIPQVTDKSWKEENQDLFPLLRLYGTAEKSATPQRRENGRWQGPEAYNIFGFSPGVADHFAIELCREKKVPVGIVYAASLYGHWIDEYLDAADVVHDPVLRKTEDAKKLVYRVGGTPQCKEMNEKRIAYMEKYLEDSEKRNSENKLVPHPEYPDYPKWAESKTSAFYNGAIHPLLPLAVRGVIFNDPNGPKPFDVKNHAAKIKLLVKSFQKWFNDPKLPVFILQEKAGKSQNTALSNTRYAAHQEIAGSDENVEIVVTHDIEDFTKPDKCYLETIPAKGHRAYVLADRKVYGNKSVKSVTPEIKSIEKKDDKVIITFSMPLKTFDGLPPDGVALKAKGEASYQPAKAELKGKSLVVSATKGKVPDQVNYCYVNQAIKKTPNLVGENNMPIAAFSTELIK